MKYCVCILLLLIIIEETVAVNKSIEQVTEEVRNKLGENKEKKTDKFIGILAQLIQSSADNRCSAITENYAQEREAKLKELQGEDPNWNRDKVAFFALSLIGTQDSMQEITGMIQKAPHLAIIIPDLVASLKRNVGKQR